MIFIELFYKRKKTGQSTVPDGEHIVHQPGQEIRCLSIVLLKEFKKEFIHVDVSIFYRTLGSHGATKFLRVEFIIKGKDSVIENILKKSFKERWRNRFYRIIL